MIIITNEKQREVIMTKEKVEKNVSKLFIIGIVLSVALIIDSIFIRASLALFITIFILLAIMIEKILADEYPTESEIILKENLLIE